MKYNSYRLHMCVNNVTTFNHGLEALRGGNGLRTRLGSRWWLNI